MSKCLFLLSIFSLFGHLSLAQTQRIVHNLNDSGPGSLRQAVLSSSQGDEIRISSTLLSNGSDTLFLNYPIIVSHGLKIVGQFNQQDTIYISGSDSSQLFYIDFTNTPNQQIYLDSLACINASAQMNGGAIFADSVNQLVITNSLFRDCVAGNGNYQGGGSIYCGGGSLFVQNSSFEHNSSNTSGGAICKVNGAIKLSNCLFKGNSNSNQYQGGAVASYYVDSLSVLNSAFQGNQSTGFGGGVAIHGHTSKTRFENVVFKSNSAFSGGAVSDQSSSSSYGDCTIINNTATNGPSAITQLSGGNSHVDFFNCSFINNQAPASSALIISHATSSIERCTFFKNNCSYCATDITIASTADTSTISNTTIFNTNPNYGIVSCMTTVGYLKFQSSIFHSSFFQPFRQNPNAYISSGNNIFSNTPPFSVSSDLLNIDSTTLALEPISFTEGPTPVSIPGELSVALNSGNPNDFTSAQNGPVFGIREIGSAERKNIKVDTAFACPAHLWWGNNYSYSGVYFDTIFNVNSIDSVGVLYLSKLDTSVQIKNGWLVSNDRNESTQYQWVDCDNGFSLVSGQTDSTFFPTQNGNFAVILTNNNCVDTSTCIYYDQLSSPSHTYIEPKIIFYPNPVRHTLNFSVNGAPLERILITDMHGRRLLDTTSFSENFIDVSHLKSGLYIVTTKFQNGSLRSTRISIAH